MPQCAAAWIYSAAIQIQRSLHTLAAIPLYISAVTNICTGGQQYGACGSYADAAACASRMCHYQYMPQCAAAWIYSVAMQIQRSLHTQPLCLRSALPSHRPNYVTALPKQLPYLRTPHAYANPAPMQPPSQCNIRAHVNTVPTLPSRLATAAVPIKPPRPKQQPPRSCLRL